LQSLNGFIARYSGLFGKGKDKDTGEDSEGDTIELTEQDKHAQHWGWYVTLDRLANKDREKWDYFLNMNIVAFLNYLAFVKDRNKWG
jgi:hypothetical protein